MWTVRELTNEQICPGLQVVEGEREGTVVYLTKEGYDSFAWIQWKGDVKPETAIKNGDSDLQVMGWLR